MKNSLNIYYFPQAVRYVSGIAFIFAFYIASHAYLFMAVLLIFIGLFILTAKYVTSFDKKNKSIQDYFSVLGLKANSEKIHYNVLNQIIITKENKGYTANSRSRTRQVKWSQYDAHLIYDDQNSFKLLSNNSKKELMAEIKALVQFLDLTIADQTSRTPYTVSI